MVVVLFHGDNVDGGDNRASAVYVLNCNADIRGDWERERDE